MSQWLDKWGFGEWLSGFGVGGGGVGGVGGAAAATEREPEGMGLQGRI